MYRSILKKIYLANECYRMQWYSIEDEGEVFMGNVDVQIVHDDKKITVIRSVFLKDIEQTWTDYSIVGASDLSPIFHSSFSSQRDLTLKFGRRIVGNYMDKGNGKVVPIDFFPRKRYYDSSIFPHLIRWSNLETGKPISIPLYNHVPYRRDSLIAGRIFEIAETDYMRANETAKALSVKATSGITKHGSVTTFTIDRETRLILRMGVENEGRKSFMVQVKVVTSHKVPKNGHFTGQFANSLELHI